jgi:hypothetical protein
MAPSTAAIWGLRTMKECHSGDYIAWAVGLLESGFDSRHLRILAGLDGNASLFETEDYFARTNRELGLSVPSKEEAIRAYSVHIAEQIVDARLSPRDGVKRLFNLCTACDYPPYLSIWFALDDACDHLEYGSEPFTYPGLSEENLRETVIKEARKFIAEQKMTQT